MMHMDGMTMGYVSMCVIGCYVCSVLWAECLLSMVCIYADNQQVKCPGGGNQ